MRYLPPAAALALLALLALVPPAQPYAKGAPEGSCDDMTPQHHVPPQTGPSPYSLSAAKGRDTVQLTLKGEPFKGFLVIARDAQGRPVGTFKQTPGAKVIDCSGKKSGSGITHAGPDDKDSATLSWDPKGFKGTVTFHYTTARNGGEFWVGQKSQPFTV